LEVFKEASAEELTEAS